MCVEKNNSVRTAIHARACAAARAREREVSDFTSEGFELISHILQRDVVARQVVIDRELERRRVLRQLELAALAERLHDRRVEEERLHSEPREVECPVEWVEAHQRRTFDRATATSLLS